MAQRKIELLVKKAGKPVVRVMTKVYDAIPDDVLNPVDDEGNPLPARDPATIGLYLESNLTEKLDNLAAEYGADAIEIDGEEHTRGATEWEPSLAAQQEAAIQTEMRKLALAEAKKNNPGLFPA